MKLHTKNIKKDTMKLISNNLNNSIVTYSIYTLSAQKL